MNGHVGGEPPSLNLKFSNTSTYMQKIPGRIIVEWMNWTQVRYDEYTEYGEYIFKLEQQKFKDATTKQIGDFK